MKKIMNKKGFSQILMLFAGLILLIGLLYFGSRYISLNIINQDSRLSDKFSLIDCGYDDVCGSPDDTNVDDTLIFQDGHKADSVLQLVPANACETHLIICRDAGSQAGIRKLFNSSLFINGKKFVPGTDRLSLDNPLRSQDVKAEIFYTWGIQDSQGRYYPYTSSSGSLDDCVSQGLCYNEHGSIIFRIEPKGQGATTTIPMSTTIPAITTVPTTVYSTGSSTTIQPTTTIYPGNSQSNLSIFSRIWLYIKNLFSKL